MLLKINSDKPEGRKIRSVGETLRNGGLVIYPTDTVYALGCDSENEQAIDRLCKLRQLDPKNAMLTLLCQDLSQAAAYTPPLETGTFKFLKRNVPGPITFILPSSKLVPKMFKNRKKTVGIRIPDHAITQAIVQELGRPLVTASLKSDDDILEYFTDPETIFEAFKKQVAVVVDGGICGNTPSTIVDLTSEEPAVIRTGEVFPQW